VILVYTSFEDNVLTEPSSPNLEFEGLAFGTVADEAETNPEILMDEAIDCFNEDVLTFCGHQSTNAENLERLGTEPERTGRKNLRVYS
jgi:hypothetical protein